MRHHAPLFLYWRRRSTGRRAEDLPMRAGMFVTHRGARSTQVRGLGHSAPSLRLRRPAETLPQPDLRDLSQATLRQRCRDDSPGVLLDLLQVRPATEALRVDLVDVFGARWS